MIYVKMMAGGVLIYAALGFICWALCKAKTRYERELTRGCDLRQTCDQLATNLRPTQVVQSAQQERSEDNGKTD